MSASTYYNKKKAKNLGFTSLLRFASLEKQVEG
jgi:hypothetical protein